MNYIVRIAYPSLVISAMLLSGCMGGGGDGSEDGSITLSETQVKDTETKIPLQVAQVNPAPVPMSETENLQSGGANTQEIEGPDSEENLLVAGEVQTPVGVKSSTNKSDPFLMFSNGEYKGFNLGKGINSTIERSDFERLKSNGFNLFRVNLKLEYIETGSEFIIHDGSRAFIDRIHPILQEFDLKLIISLTGVTREDWDRSSLTELLTNVWMPLVKKYKNDDVVVAFDIVNEPIPDKLTHSAGAEYWESIALDVIDSIREVSNKVVIYEPAPWGLPNSFKWFKVLNHDNVVYSFHMYDPHEFTHQGINQYTESYMYPNESKGWDIDYLRNKILPVVQFQQDHNVPIYVGEFSAIRYAGDSRTNYIRDLLLLWNEHDWAWTFHSLKGWSGWDPEIPSTDPRVIERDKDSDVMKLLVEYTNL